MEHSPISTHSTDVADGEMADVEDNTGPTPIPPRDQQTPLEDDDTGSIVVSYCGSTLKCGLKKM